MTSVVTTSRVGNVNYARMLLGLTVTEKRLDRLRSQDHSSDELDENTHRAKTRTEQRHNTQPETWQTIALTSLLQPEGVEAWSIL